MKKHTFGSEYQISVKRITEIDSAKIIEFNCGNPSLNKFFRGDLPNFRNSVTYVFYDDENDMIVGFGAICCNAIQVSIRDPKGGYTTNMPAIDIDYFAIDEHYRGIVFEEGQPSRETLSSALFKFLLKLCIDISKKYIGATVISLYSVPRAEHFYSRCGFRRFDDYMLSDEKPFFDGCVPMLMEI